MSDWVCFYMIRFEDGTGEGQVLHRGTQEECEEAESLLPAIAYSGGKKVLDCRVHVSPNHHDMIAGQIILVEPDEQPPPPGGNGT